MTRRLFHLILVLLIGVSCSRNLQFSNIESCGCYRIPITSLFCSELPITIIEIENKRYSVLIDSGGKYPFTLDTSSLEEIKGKKLAAKIESCDIKGDVYLDNLYEINHVKLGKLEFGGSCKEDSQKYLARNSSIFHPDEISARTKKKLRSIHGRVGMGLLKYFSCVFDLDHKSLLISNDFNILKKIVSFDDCEEVSFINENGWIILEVSTNFGMKKMLLDTGSSKCLISVSNIDKTLAKEVEPGVWRSFLQMQIGSLDCGEREFYFYEFGVNSRKFFDGILGVDFFQDHIISVDFQNNKAYIKHLNKPLMKFWKKILRIFC